MGCEKKGAEKTLSRSKLLSKLPSLNGGAITRGDFFFWCVCVCVQGKIRVCKIAAVWLNKMVWLDEEKEKGATTPTYLLVSLEVFFLDLSPPL